MWKSKRFSIGSALLWLYSLFTLFILVYMTYNSLRTKSDLLTNTFGRPRKITFAAYKSLFVDEHFFRYFLNSMLILVISLLILIALASMAAYGLGRFQFRFKNVLMLYFLIGLMFPGNLGIVPIFLLIRSMGLLNSYASVILILSAGMSMSVFLLTVFFAKLPKDIYESAKMDGATEWKNFYKIMLPLASPVVFSICIIMSVQIWNQFFLPLVFLQSDDKKVIPQLILKLTGNLMFTIDRAMAASVLATVPILILFYMFSQKVLDGVASGGVKG